MYWRYVPRQRTSVVRWWREFQCATPADFKPLINLCVDACGGMASEATRLVQVIGEEGERWSAGTWSAVSIQRQLLSAIAVAVQRGNALTVLSGFTRTTRAGVMRGVREDAAIRERGASEDGGESSGVEVLPVDE